MADYGVNKGDSVDLLCVGPDGKVFTENVLVRDVIYTSSRDYIIYLEERGIGSGQPITVRSITIRHRDPYPLRFT